MRKTMAKPKTKLELTWIGKENRPKPGAMAAWRPWHPAVHLTENWQAFEWAEANENNPHSTE